MCLCFSEHVCVSLCVPAQDDIGTHTRSGFDERLSRVHLQRSLRAARHHTARHQSHTPPPGASLMHHARGRTRLMASPEDPPPQTTTKPSSSMRVFICVKIKSYLNENNSVFCNIFSIKMIKTHVKKCLKFLLFKIINIDTNKTSNIFPVPTCVWLCADPISVWKAGFDEVV